MTALRPTSHDVHIARDGKQGLDLIERLRPDVVFSAVAMPEMDLTKPFTLAEVRARVAHYSKN